MTPDQIAAWAAAGQSETVEFKRTTGERREALANAFCHRDYAIGGGSVGVAIYDDRLEVTSSGTLHFGLTPDALFRPHESLPWNPLIEGVFYRRGIIESWGRGTLKMAELAVSAGLPRPEIEDAGGCVTVRFRPSRYVPPQRVGLELTERQRAILAVLDEAGSGLALREIHTRLSGQTGECQVREDLATLRTQNVRAQLRVLVKRILRKYGYPPDKQEKATQTVLEQAEVLSHEWAAA